MLRFIAMCQKPDLGLYSSNVNLLGAWCLIAHVLIAVKPVGGRQATASTQSYQENVMFTFLTFSLLFVLFCRKVEKVQLINDK
jgi:hypothetical protein